MFQINYVILDEEKKRLSMVKSIKDFEEEIDTIMGQMELIFNKQTFGFIVEDLVDCDEFLLIWLELLNEVLIQLHSSPFVTMISFDDDNLWFEFECVGDLLRVNHIRTEDARKEHITKNVTVIPYKRKECLWSEEISKEEFIREVLTVTDRFIKEVISINEIVVETREFRGINDRYQKAKQIWMDI